MLEILGSIWQLIVDIFSILGIDIEMILIILVVGSLVIFVVPSITRSIAARTSGRLTRSVRGATTPFYGQKGTGIYKNPSRTVKNKVYRSRSKKLF